MAYFNLLTCHFTGEKFARNLSQNGQPWTRSGSLMVSWLVSRLSSYMVANCFIRIKVKKKEGMTHRSKEDPLSFAVTNAQGAR
jgi:hypothetical protein